MVLLIICLIFIFSLKLASSCLKCYRIEISLLMKKENTKLSFVNFSYGDNEILILNLLSVHMRSLQVIFSKMSELEEFLH